MQLRHAAGTPGTVAGKEGREGRCTTPARGRRARPSTLGRVLRYTHGAAKAVPGLNWAPGRYGRQGARGAQSAHLRPVMVVLLREGDCHAFYVGLKIHKLQGCKVGRGEGEQALREGRITAHRRQALTALRGSMEIVSKATHSAGRHAPPVPSSFLVCSLLSFAALLPPVALRPASPPPPHARTRLPRKVMRLEGIPVTLTTAFQKVMMRELGLKASVRVGGKWGAKSALFCMGGGREA